MAVTQYSVRVTKSFDYRGNPAKQWSNRYYFDGASPGDATAWHTLMDALVLLEKTIHRADVSIVKCDGFAPGSDAPVASKNYTTAGTLTSTGNMEVPGDCAVVLRMATTKVSSKSHTVYVYSYFHRALVASSGSAPDAVVAAQKTAVENYADEWLNGFTVSSRTYKRTTPDGHATTGRFVDPWVGHRDFPR